MHALRFHALSLYPYDKVSPLLLKLNIRRLSQEQVILSQSWESNVMQGSPLLPQCWQLRCGALEHWPASHAAWTQENSEQGTGYAGGQDRIAAT